MQLFSHRKGLKPLKKAIQFEALDEVIRAKLWSVISAMTLEQYVEQGIYRRSVPTTNQIIEDLFKLIWLHSFSQPVDETPDFRSAYEIVKTYFFKTSWNEVLDLLELISKNIPEDWQDGFRDSINYFLESESCAYRFVGLEIRELTDETELSEVAHAFEANKNVAEHLKKALDFLSTRGKPDYRNSIKESISAVEAICRLKTKD